MRRLYGKYINGWRQHPYRWLSLHLVAMALLLGGWFYFYGSKPIITRADVGPTKVPIYAPSTPPAGFELDKSKTQSSDEVVSYAFNSTDKTRDIVVTVQPLPKKFDMTKLVGNGTVNSTATSRGTLYDLSAGGSSQYLLNTGDALVFFTSHGSIDTATINALVDDLKRQ